MNWSTYHHIKASGHHWILIDLSLSCRWMFTDVKLIFHWLNLPTYQCINLTTYELINLSSYQVIDSSLSCNWFVINSHWLVHRFIHWFWTGFSSTYQLVDLSTHKLINSSTDQSEPASKCMLFLLKSIRKRTSLSLPPNACFS